jgi:hypothetical protein
MLFQRDSGAGGSEARVVAATRAIPIYVTQGHAWSRPVTSDYFIQGLPLLQEHPKTYLPCIEDDY